MALAKTASGVRELLVKIGNGADPEVFTQNCTINAARGIELTANTNDIVVPDCSDPDLLAWIKREKVSLSAAINGAGVLNTPDALDWFNWCASALTKNVKVILDVPGADGGIIATGAFHCTQFGITGDRGGLVEASLQLQSDGEVTFEANA